MSSSVAAEIMITGVSSSRFSPRSCFQHLDAALPRHHHVEQHGVERRLGVHRQRFLAVAGDHDLLVAQALQTPAEHFPVIGIIVHHKQFHIG